MTRSDDPRPLVCHILPVLQPAGAERIAAELARRLPERGFDTRVLCLEDERAAIGRELAAEGIPVEGLRLSRRRTLACAKGIAARLPERRPLVLHAHLFHANIAARLAFARLNDASKREVVVVNTVQVVERRFRPWQFWLDRWTAKHCAIETCVSEDVYRFQQAKTGLPDDFFRVIENAVDLSRYAPRRARPGAPKRPVVVSVGRLNRQKDFPTLLRAWQIVSAALPKAVLKIAGSGSEEPALRALAASLGLKNLEFLGFVEEIPALLHEADLYVQSSLWEGLPLSVIEAMACALPVVVTDADGTRNVVTHERTGLVVSCSDAAALAGEMIRVLDDPALAGRLATAAREEAVNRFSVEKMVDAYAAVYHEALRRAGA